MWMEESLQQVCNDHEFSFEHPNRDVEQPSGCTSLQFKGVSSLKVQMMAEAREVKEKALREHVG